MVFEIFSLLRAGYFIFLIFEGGFQVLPGDWDGLSWLEISWVMIEK